MSLSVWSVMYLSVWSVVFLWSNVERCSQTHLSLWSTRIKSEVDQVRCGSSPARIKSVQPTCIKLVVTSWCSSVCDMIVVVMNSSQHIVVHCCVVQCCVALRCAVLRCVVLRCAALRCAAQRSAMLCTAVLCSAALRCAALRCAVLCCAVLCCAALRCAVCC